LLSVIVLCSRKDNIAPTQPLSILELVAQRRTNKAQIPVTTESTAVAAQANESSIEITGSTRVISETPPTNNASVKEEHRRKKRKVQQLVEGMYQKLPSDDAGICSFECLQCHKCYPSKQGVKTHCYKEHVLTVKQVDSSSTEVTVGDSSTTDTITEQHRFRCDLCDRDFPNKDASEQHRIAKHDGNFTYISVVRNEKTFPGGCDTASIGADFQCSVCQWKFPSADDLQAHLQNGVVPISTAHNHIATSSATLSEGVDPSGPTSTSATVLTCTFCPKVLRDERAWKQHVNFCRLRQNSVK
jgi:hypothetical protein